MLVTGVAAFEIGRRGGIAFQQEKALSLNGLSKLSEARVQVLSDTHLEIPKRKLASEEEGDQFHLLKYLRKINQEIKTASPSDKKAEVLVFNGDTFEIIGSCASYGDGHLPYLAKGALNKQELTRTVIREILEANKAI